MAKRFTFEVLIYDRPGDSLDDSTDRLARRLESAGLIGEIRHGTEDGVGDDMTGIAVPFGRTKKQKEEK